CQAFDAAGNAITSSAGSVFDVSLTGPATVPVSVNDLNTGAYTASYTATVAGTYTLFVNARVPSGLTGRYYSDTTLSTLYVTAGNPRVDSTVNFNFGLTPIFTGFPINFFGIVWSGLIAVPQSGVWTFFIDTSAAANFRLIIKSV